MANFKNITSVGLTEDNGAKIIAYSYDEIDETTGERKKLNCKGSRVVVRSQKDVLNAIKVINDFAQTLADSEN